MQEKVEELNAETQSMLRKSREEEPKSTGRSACATRGSGDEQDRPFGFAQDRLKPVLLVGQSMRMRWGLAAPLTYLRTLCYG